MRGPPHEPETGVGRAFLDDDLKMIATAPGFPRGAQEIRRSVHTLNAKSSASCGNSKEGHNILRNRLDTTRPARYPTDHGPLEAGDGSVGWK
jgi:hypothetical protein